MRMDLRLKRILLLSIKVGRFMYYLLTVAIIIISVRFMWASNEKYWLFACMLAGVPVFFLGRYFRMMKKALERNNQSLFEMAIKNLRFVFMSVALFFLIFNIFLLVLSYQEYRMTF